MRRLILWLILATFISGLALEAAQPAWTPAPGRKHAIVKVKKIKKRHARKKRKKRRKHRRVRRTRVEAAPASRGLLAAG